MHLQGTYVHTVNYSGLAREIESRRLCTYQCVAPLPSPLGGVGLIWGIWPYLRSNSPSHTKKQVIKESSLCKARFKSPSMGPTFQVKLDQIPPYVPGGGVVGQHVDRCIRNVHRNNQTAMDKIMRTLLIAVSWFTICIKTITQVHAFHFNFHFEVLLPLCSPALPISFLFLPTITEKCPFNHNHTYVSMQSQVCVCLGVVSSGVGRGGLTGLEPPPFWAPSSALHSYYRMMSFKEMWAGPPNAHADCWGEEWWPSKILATPLVRIHLKCCSFEWIAGNTSASQQQLDKGNLLHRPVPLGSPWPLYKNP